MDVFDRQLAPDERLVIFPSYAVSQGGGHWRGELRAWVSEPEEGSAWRERLIAALGDAMDLPEEGSEERGLLERRLRWFLADNERLKELRLELAGQPLALPLTRANGHAVGQLDFRLAGEAGGWQSLCYFRGDQPETVERAVECIPPEGWSVISDIDDTIKISEVLDKAALLRNTFTRPFGAVPGVAARYRRWREEGASFHYVSASPWQLFPDLEDFMDREGFPRGSVHLRNLSLAEGDLIRFIGSSRPFKQAVVEAIIEDFPERRFVLVGDTAENDPDIYAAAAHRFPERVAAVFLRTAQGGPAGGDASSSERCGDLFAGLPDLRWDLFDAPPFEAAGPPVTAPEALPALAELARN